MDGAMYNSGQCCCGIERIYVHESLYDAFVEKSVDWVSKLGSAIRWTRRRRSARWRRKRFADTVRGADRRGGGARARSR